MRRRPCFVCGNALVRQRSTRRFCSNACRQSAYRRRCAPKVWHRVPRARLPQVTRVTASLAAAEVRQISTSQAKAVIEQKEPMCVAPTHAFGLFLGQALASVVVFGVHPGANLSPTETLALLRGFTLPWAPRNCGSKLIRDAMALLPAGYRCVVAFADAMLGERGTIYRAAGFKPLGPSRGGRRILVHHQGKVISGRSARRRFGTSSAQTLAALGLKVETVPRRSRWIATESCRAARRPPLQAR